MNTDIKVGHKKITRLRFKWSWRQFQLQTMVWPGIIFLFLFSYVTMYGIVVAFQKYNLVLGFFGSPWVGLKHFKDLLTDNNIWRALRNSIGMNILGLLLGFPAPILFAVLLNEVRHKVFKRVIQSVSYLPHFVSWVIYGGLVIVMLRPGSGILNNALMQLGLIKEQIAFLAKPQYFWIIVVLTGIIKGIGWGSIIYLAAIAGIDQEIYDAAFVDGAGRIDRIRYITLPSIIPTIMIMLVFSIAGILNTGFDQIWMLQNGLNISTSEVLDTYTYKVGIQKMQFSFATAVGLANSIVAIILLVSANAFSKKLTEESLF